MSSNNKFKQSHYMALGCATAFALVSAGSFAQTEASSTLTAADLGITGAQLKALARYVVPPKSSPGFSMGSPTAYGASWGSIGVGIGGATTDSPDLDHDVDGSMGVVFGLGNAADMVGLEASVNIISLTNNGPDSGFGEDGNVNFKIHRLIKQDLAVAVGIENEVTWGLADSRGSSTYIVGTKVMTLDTVDTTQSLVFNLGIGDGGRFDPDGEDGAGIFGTAAWIIDQKYSLIADWTGSDLNLGVSIAPLYNYPLTITLGAINLGERLDREAEFSGGIGYGFSF
ncbi:MAG: hypothetical protein MI976_22995 [Pseudomonadales bacterium]|nr:hypothetical protein [Pseudomonadales bacterium]